MDVGGRVKQEQLPRVREGIERLKQCTKLWTFYPLPSPLPARERERNAGFTMRDKARELRKNQTDAETKIWQLVRAKQIERLKFRRQHPVQPYIVDFVCLEKKLIIEIDGGQHAEAVDYDKKRTRFLESKGYTVIRFWNNEVLNNIEGVYEVILQHLR